MAFENDPDGYAIAQAYAGSGFDRPRIVPHEVLRERSNSWSVDEFLKMVADAIESIPEGSRSSAVVELEDDYDCFAALVVRYNGPESTDVVSERVARCQQHVAKVRRNEKADYERLKAKFER